MLQSVRLALRPLLTALVLLIPASTMVSAAGSFDGTYRGTQRVTQQNNTPECDRSNSDKAVVEITNNRFTRRWLVDLTVDVAADGSFAATGAVGGTRTFRAVEIKGRIVNGAFEADIGSNTCTAHLSLKKS